MKDRELLQLILRQVGALTNQAGTLNDRGNAIATNMVTLNNQVGAITEEVVSIKETVVIIENDHRLQLKVLFDGYKLNGDKLDRIAAEVVNNEEVILRRIR